MVSLSCLTAGSMVDRLRVISLSLSLLSDCWVYGRQAEGDLSLSLV